MKILKLRNYFPKSILGRILIIIVVPVFFVQLATAWFFYDNHWEKIGRSYAKYFAYDINAIFDLMETFPGEDAFNWIQEFARDNLKMDIELIKAQNVQIPDNNHDSRLRWFYEEFTNEFAGSYFLNPDFPNRRVTFFLEFSDDTFLQAETSIRRIYNSSEAVFIIIVLTSTIAIFIFLFPFIRNQIRSIKSLAKAADKFGKGQSVSDFKPTGAYEIRQAGKAFLTMKERIKSYIENRTLMLSGISHDLRTPITRMKIQLEMLPASKEKAELIRDVKDMEKMIENYLNFAKFQEEEKTKKVNIINLLENIIDKLTIKNRNIYFDKDKYRENYSNYELEIRPNGMERALTNVLNNAIRYSKQNINVILKQNKKEIIIIIDDDGEGIPKEKREQVFKPFARGEESRNQDTGGVGLGLTIVQQLILTHGGNIELLDSPLSGLRVRITLPKN
jgi:two-component system osmolarity sensor histidine kinase EnvZ